MSRRAIDIVHNRGPEYICLSTLQDGCYMDCPLPGMVLNLCVYPTGSILIADETLGRESRDAPAPGASGAYALGATSSRRSGRAPASGADAPSFSSF